MEQILLYEAAEKFLKRDYLLFVDMLECLRQKKAVVLFADDGGVLLYEKQSRIYMLAATNGEVAENALRLLENEPFSGDRCFIVAHGESAKNAVYARLPVARETKCYQVVYRGQPRFLRGSLDFRSPRAEDLAMIKQVYALESPENIDALNGSGKLFGAYLKETGDFVGFIGSHPEGSMGMLHVFEKYRRKGYAEEIEGFLINRYLQNGEAPYGHVIFGNEASVRLQEKLGFETAKEFVYWLRIDTEKR
ncbi:MAG: GNAT family N-acetyltransferase [Clostridia bacterium]|nr:GNAT family N-acetyltransferase [Clostridia bacterium]